LSLITVVGSGNFSLFVVVIIFVVAFFDLGQIQERDGVAAHTLAVPQQQQQPQLIVCFKAAHSDRSENGKRAAGNCVSVSIFFQY
jgi:hypothetical protein